MNLQWKPKLPPEARVAAVAALPRPPQAIQPSVCMRLSQFHARQEKHLQKLFVSIIFYHVLSCLVLSFSFFLGVVVLRVLKDLVSIKPCTKLKQTTKSDINSNATWNNAPSLSKSLGSRRSAKAPKSLTRQKHPRLCLLESKGSQEAVLFFFECVTAMQYANRSYGSYACKVVRSWALENRERSNVVIV